MTADLTRAAILHQSGRLRQAERACSEVLAANAGNAGAWHLLGLIAAERGQPALGAGFIGRAIQIQGPVPDWCLHLGTILEHEHNLPGAAACFRQALDLNKQDANTAFRLGNLLSRSGQLEEAAARYRQVVELKPQFAEAWFNLGVVCAMQSRIAEAMAGYRKAIELEPAYAEAHNNLGIMLHACGHLEQAGAAYQQALASRGGYTEARYNLAQLWQRQDRLEDAETAYRAVIAAQPAHAEAHNNLGNVLLAANRPQKARDCYRQALTIDAEHVESHWNLGVADLLLGNFADGWPGYEWRFRQHRHERRHGQHPLWRGEPLDGRRLLIWAEQGLGDTIQMVRFVERVQAANGVVIVECQRPLARLLESARGIDGIVIRGESLPEFDLQIPVMSLPGVFAAGIGDFSAAVPYLKAEPESVARWRDRLAQYSSPKIGLAWSGNPKHTNDRNRSLAVDYLAPLISTPASFFTLQPDAVAPAGVVSLAEHLTDFAETAALMEALDLVISVDTSVAHVAGALGRPVWTLLPHAPDWRWMLDREDSPWYPSMRLFRQPQRADWPDVIERVSRELSSVR